jgi:beta-mannosidase
VERAAGGYTVTVTATTLQRDVALLADKVAPAAVSDDMLITLLAGETAAFHVRTDQDLDAGALAEWDVLRSANQLLHPSARVRYAP